MTKIEPTIELFLEKKFTELRNEAKKDRHEHNNYVQNIIVQQWNKIDKLREESKDAESNILNKIKWLYARKWVERLLFSAWTFVIFWVCAIFWNVFQDKLTIWLEWLIK